VSMSMSRFRFVILLSIPSDEQIGREVILNLVVKQSFSVLHHSLFLLVFGVHQLLLLELRECVILRCLGDFGQHLKLICDVDLLLFEFDLSGIWVEPLLDGCRRASSWVALSGNELDRLVWVHLSWTFV